MMSLGGPELFLKFFPLHQIIARCILLLVLTCFDYYYQPIIMSILKSNKTYKFVRHFHLGLVHHRRQRSVNSVAVLCEKAEKRWNIVGGHQLACIIYPVDRYDTALHLTARTWHIERRQPGCSERFNYLSEGSGRFPVDGKNVLIALIDIVVVWL
jgi:hypothetical protein